MPLKTPILRSRPHRVFVASWFCVVEMRGRLVWRGTPESQAAHVRYLGTCGIGMKPSDEFCVPLSPETHMAQHAFGDERGWWESKGLDPARIAAELCQRSPHIREETV